MMRFFLIVIVCLIASCDEKSNQTNNGGNSILSLEKEPINNPEENSTANEAGSGILKLPVIGTFEMTGMKIDSINEYGAGDCWGKVKRYSSSNAGLAIDSMTCGEYGYTYTYYILGTKDFIEVVFTKKSESILNPESNSYFYVQQEHVINLNSDPAMSMTRIDTIYDYNLRENQIDKKFINDTLEDRQATYEYLELEYHKVWEMALNY